MNDGGYEEHTRAQTALVSGLIGGQRQPEALLSPCGMQNSIPLSTFRGSQGARNVHDNAAAFKPTNQARIENNRVAVVYLNKCHPSCSRNHSRFCSANGNVSPSCERGGLRAVLIPHTRVLQVSLDKERASSPGGPCSGQLEY